MKHISNSLLGLMISLLLCSCSTHKVTITPWTNSGQFSAAIWYTQEKISTNDTASVIPLLVQAEWGNTPEQYGKLALVFLHGRLFAQCDYEDTELTCTTTNVFPGAKAIAYDCAILISAAINNLQGLPVHILPKWDFNIQSPQDSKQGKTMLAKDNLFQNPVYSLQQQNVNIVLEVKEILWD